uniref:Uncharacterized protein n=1 Tax=Romanomermis culicivorax TaxID=13658 RepID=A0A915IB89_ROMCU
MAPAAVAVESLLLLPPLTTGSFSRPLVGPSPSAPVSLSPTPSPLPFCKGEVVSIRMWAPDQNLNHRDP